MSTDISIIAPVYNEEGNLLPLHDELVQALTPLQRCFEIIYVDDGSCDGSFAELSKIASADARARVVQFRRNFGQTAAIAAGIRLAHGSTLVFIDADLQNDPADIPRLLALVEQGYDVVSGWRKERKDRALSRRLPSHIANSLISWVTGVQLHDYGCTLKAYRAEVLHEINLYGEMHRFLPAYLAQVGARIAEIPVHHRPRLRGISKYGMMRTLRVLLDLLTVKFFGSYSTKPIYIFGGVGLFLIAVSLAIGLAMAWQKIVLGVPLTQTTLLLLAALLFLMGVQAILLGLLSELVMRTYYESRGKPTYHVRTILNP